MTLCFHNGKISKIETVGTSDASLSPSWCSARHQGGVGRGTAMFCVSKEGVGRVAERSRPQPVWLEMGSRLVRRSSNYYVGRDGARWRQRDHPGTDSHVCHGAGPLARSRTWHTGTGRGGPGLLSDRLARFHCTSNDTELQDRNLRDGQQSSCETAAGVLAGRLIWRGLAELAELRTVRRDREDMSVRSATARNRPTTVDSPPRGRKVRSRGYRGQLLTRC
jgi:hypothetical protein